MFLRECMVRDDMLLRIRTLPGHGERYEWEICAEKMTKLGDVLICSAALLLLATLSKTEEKKKGRIRCCCGGCVVDGGGRKGKSGSKKRQSQRSVK